MAAHIETFQGESDTFCGTTDEREFYKCCDNGRLDRAKFLLDEGRVGNIDCTNEFDFTPLINVSRKKKDDTGLFPRWIFETAQMLLELGANASCVTCDEESPLHWACKRNNLELVKLLLGKHPECPIGTKGFLEPSNVYLVDKKGETARKEAEKKRFTNVLNMIKQAEIDQKKSKTCIIL